jgi:putative glutamine amidotransferase
MKKPVIGMLGRIYFDGRESILNYEKTYVPTDYADSVVMAGGIPIIFPIVQDKALIRSQLELVDGLLVPGGVDISPLIYGEEPIARQGVIFEEIDEFDIEAIKAAHDMKKPILGICRGLQSINVAFGGTLYQDLSAIEGCYIKHRQEARKEFGSHTVQLKKDTKLYEILGERITANSYHHQVIKDLAPGFEATAHALDGIIEGIEMKGSNFIIAVQWHPEMMAKTRPDMLGIFKRFIDEIKIQDR